MLRFLLILLLPALCGCMRKASPAPDTESKPAAIDLTSGPGEPYQGELVVKEVAILGVTPGKTTLEEFKKRFHVAEVKETAAQGVLTADAGPGAVLEGDGLKFDRLTGAFLDGVLIDMKARGAGRTFPPAIAQKFGLPEEPSSSPLKWTIGGITIIHFEAADGIPATIQAFETEKCLLAFDRGGFAGLGGHNWDD